MNAPRQRKLLGDCTIPAKDFAFRKEYPQWNRQRFIAPSDIDPATRRIVSCNASSVADDPEYAPRFVHRGDVLLLNRPTGPLVAEVTAEYDRCVVNCGFFILRPIPKLLATRYLYHVAQSRDYCQRLKNLPTKTDYQGALADMASHFPELEDELIGIANGQYKLFARLRVLVLETELANFPIHVPSLEQQQDISERLDRQEALYTASLQETISQLKTMREWRDAATGDAM